MAVKGRVMPRQEFSKAVCSIEGCDKPTVGRGWCRPHYNRWYRLGSPTAGGTAKGALPKWLMVHVYHQGTECLIWPFGRATGGRGTIRFNGVAMHVSRVMCILAHGAPPTPQHDAAHSCGNGSGGCVNPCHLRWATKKENMADKLIHGGDGRGSNNSQAKLSTRDVTNIRRLAVYEPHHAIADLFGVTRQHITNIVTRKRWAWL